MSAAQCSEDCTGPFCDACGDCLTCYGEDPCSRSSDGKHVEAAGPARGDHPDHPVIDLRLRLTGETGEERRRAARKRYEAALAIDLHRRDNPCGPAGAISADTVGRASWATGRIEAPNGANLSERYLILWCHEDPGVIGCYAGEDGEPVTQVDEGSCDRISPDPGGNIVVVTVDVPGVRYVGARPTLSDTGTWHLRGETL